MKILVTGKNGYIGSSIINKLEAYNYNITGVGREDFDLTDRKSTNTYFDCKKFDIIIHTAICGGSRLVHDRDDVLSNNIKMFYNLLNNQNKFGQLINFGSGAELNNPSLPYGLSKAIIWDIIKNNSKLNNIRIFGVFDENELDTRFIKTCIKNYKNRKPILIHQNKLFDFIYMDDLVTIVNFIILNPNIKSIDCCYKESYTLREIADYINTLDNHCYKIKVNHKKLNTPYKGQFVDYNLDLIGLKQGINNVYTTLNI
jgi:nucleoside-diphosphate-sugar epimerase